MVFIENAFISQSKVLYKYCTGTSIKKNNKTIIHPYNQSNKNPNLRSFVPEAVSPVQGASEGQYLEKEETEQSSTSVSWLENRWKILF